MGTKSFIIVWDPKHNEYIATYRTVDGDPDYMMQWVFKWTRCFMENYYESYLPHFLSNPDDIASAMIVTTWLLNPVHIVHNEKINPPKIRPITIPAEAVKAIIQHSEDTISLNENDSMLYFDYVYLLTATENEWLIDAFKVEYTDKLLRLITKEKVIGCSINADWKAITERIKNILAKN